MDKAGFIISHEPEIASRGGNSLQHTSMFLIFCYSMMQNMESFVQGSKRAFAMWKLATAYGEPRLHWDITYWPGETGHTSRDNLFSAICLLKMYNLKSELRAILFCIIMRIGFLWNYKNIGSAEVNTKYITIFGKRVKFAHRDWCGPLMWMIAFRFKWNPLNIISDLYLWAAIKVQLRNTKRDLTHTDGHLNLIVACETCRLVRSNLILNKILRWYKKTGIPQFALDDYFDNEYSPPLHDLGKAVINNWK